MQYTWDMEQHYRNYQWLVCGASYNVNNDLTRGDLIGDLLSTVCKDVELEPTLQPLTGEHFTKKSVNTEVGARLDVSARVDERTRVLM